MIDDIGLVIVIYYKSICRQACFLVTVVHFERQKTVNLE